MLNNRIDIRSLIWFSPQFIIIFLIAVKFQNHLKSGSSTLLAINDDVTWIVTMETHWNSTSVEKYGFNHKLLSEHEHHTEDTSFSRAQWGIQWSHLTLCYFLATVLSCLDDGLLTWLLADHIVAETWWQPFSRWHIQLVTAFSWLKMYKFRLRFHLSLFPIVW